LCQNQTQCFTIAIAAYDVAVNGSSAEKVFKDLFKTKFNTGFDEYKKQFIDYYTNLVKSGKPGTPPEAEIIALTRKVGGIESVLKFL